MKKLLFLAVALLAANGVAYADWLDGFNFAPAVREDPLIFKQKSDLPYLAAQGGFNLAGVAIGSGSSNTLILHPAKFWEDTPVRKLLASLSSGGSGSSVIMGLWEDNNGRPGKGISVTVAISSTASTDVSVSFPMTIPRGKYWFASCSYWGGTSPSAPTFRTFSSISAFATWTGASSAALVGGTQGFVTYPYNCPSLLTGSLPDLSGLTTDLVGTTGGAPLIFYVP